MIDIVICDDHKLVREGLKQIIQEDEDINVLADVSSGEELLRKLHTLKIQVIILDIALPGRSGLEVLKQIKISFPDVQVLVLSMYPEDQFAIRMIKAGASGYLHKDTNPNILCGAIKIVARGEKFINPKISSLLMEELTLKKQEKPAHKSLSDREYEVLLFLGKGKKVGEIAEILSLSKKTVSTYKTRLLEKLGVSNESGLTQYLLRHELITGSEKIG